MASQGGDLWAARIQEQLAGLARQSTKEREMEDKEKKEVHHTGFEYLGPQSEHTGNLPPLPKRFKVRDEPVAGAEPIEK